MLVYHPPHINPVKWITAIHEWKSVIQDISSTHCLTQPFMSAHGSQLLKHILLRNEPKANIIMLQYHMQPKSLLEYYISLNHQVNNIKRSSNKFNIISSLRAPETVSYTHLDVYKRQIKYCEPIIEIKG